MEVAQAKLEGRQRLGRTPARRQQAMANIRRQISALYSAILRTPLHPHFLRQQCVERPPRQGCSRNEKYGIPLPGKKNKRAHRSSQRKRLLQRRNAHAKAGRKADVSTHPKTDPTAHIEPRTQETATMNAVAHAKGATRKEVGPKKEPTTKPRSMQ